MGRHSTEAESLIRATDVTVRYGDVIALRDVNLPVAAGDLIAVTGTSGAGKTSLLNVLAGVVPPASGDVRYAGTRLTDRDSAVSRGIVLIPQGNALVATLTALENVAIPLLAQRDAAHSAPELALDALTELGVDEAADQLVDELSGGQQQRVAVARGLAQHGTILVADEPTSELDATNRAIVMTLLRREADRGAAVVIATHDPDAAAQCDAELRLDEGTASWA